MKELMTLQREEIITLGIETSCDETAASIIKGSRETFQKLRQENIF